MEKTLQVAPNERSLSSRTNHYLEGEGLPFFDCHFSLLIVFLPKMNERQELEMESVQMIKFAEKIYTPRSLRYCVKHVQKLKKMLLENMLTVKNVKTVLIVMELVIGDSHVKSATKSSLGAC